MISINSLKRINEIEKPEDIRYKSDLDAANTAYDKVDTYAKTGFVPRKFRYLLTPDSKVAEAAADRDRAIDLAEARKKAAKMGMVSKEDYDELRYQAAKNTAAERAAKSAAERAAKSAASQAAEHTSDEKPGILRKIGGAIAEHPLIAAGTVAGIAGLAALQKRRKTNQPQQY